MADVEDLRIILRTEVEKAVADLRKGAKGAKDANKSFDDLAKQFKKQVAEATSMNRAFSQMAGSVAAGLGAFTLASKAVQGLSQLARESVQAFQVQEQAVAKLDAVLRATGGAAGLTSREMQDFASELQAATTFGDEAIINMQGTLATFKSVSGDTFKDATRLALDLSAAFGSDLQSSAMQVGKALEDPVKGVSALQRVGVSFSEAQKDLIKQMVETGDKAGAQRLILKELEGQVGGVAGAMANTASGSIQQYKNALGDTKEEVGRFIVNGLEPLTKVFTRVAGAIRGVLKEQNDYNEAIRAVQSGSATTDQRLLVLAQQRKDLEAQIRLMDQQKGLAEDLGGFTQEQYQYTIAQLNAVRRQQQELSLSISLQGKAAEAAKARADAEVAAAEKAAAEKDALEKYLDRVNSKYAQTSEGRIALLEKEIAEFEAYAKTAERTAPQVAAVLGMLREQLDKAKNPGADVKSLVPSESLERLQSLFSKTEDGIAAAKRETIEFVDAMYAAAIAAAEAGGNIGMSFEELDAIRASLTKDTSIADRLKSLYASTAAGADEAKQEVLAFVRAQREAALAGAEVGLSIAQLDTLFEELQTQTASTEAAMIELGKSIIASMSAIAQDAFLDFFTAIGEGANGADAFGQAMGKMAQEATRQIATLALTAGVRVLAESGLTAWPIAAALFGLAGVSAMASGALGGAMAGPRQVDYSRYITDPVIEEEKRLAAERLRILKDQLEREKRIRDENLRKLEAHFSQEFEVLRDLWDRGLVSTSEFESRATGLRADQESQRAAAEKPYADAENALAAEQETQRLAKEALDQAKAQKLDALARQAAAMQQELNGMSAWDRFWTTKDERLREQLDALDRRIQITQGAQTIEQVRAAATGADYVTNGPELLMVGDNPGGRERVRVEPIGSPNIHGPRGGEGVVIQINAPIYGVDHLYEVLQQAGRRLSKRHRIVSEAF